LQDILPGENLMAEKSGLDPEMADEEKHHAMI
jgi:hypothetical protein